MRKVGLNKEEIEEQLYQKISKDCDFTSGFILGSMCTEPLQYSRDVYSRYLHINVGDKGISPCTANVEKHLISDVAALFHGTDIVGNFTSGGTEGNVIAIRIPEKIWNSLPKQRFCCRYYPKPLTNQFGWQSVLQALVLR